MAQINLSIPPALKNWVDAKVAEGRYSSASDYVRDLVRRDQEAVMAETEWLRGLIAEGLASGVVDEEPEAVIENIIARRRARARQAAA
jgi:antitoxin ParD1/3/4